MSDDPKPHEAEDGWVDEGDELYLAGERAGFKRGEQAGFERGVQAEREAWIAGNRGMDAGRAERDAEIRAWLENELAEHIDTMDTTSKFDQGVEYAVRHALARLVGDGTHAE